MKRVKYAILSLVLLVAAWTLYSTDVHAVTPDNPLGGTKWELTHINTTGGAYWEGYSIEIGGNSYTVSPGLMNIEFDSTGGTFNASSTDLIGFSASAVSVEYDSNPSFLGGWKSESFCEGYCFKYYILNDSSVECTVRIPDVGSAFLRQKSGGDPDPDPSPEPAPSPEPEQPKTVQQQEEEPVEVPFNPVIVSTDKTEFNNENANVIPGDTYNFSRCIMTDEAVKGINKILEKNPAQKNITIYSGKAITFNKEFLDNIRAKNITLTYYFMHQGHLYSVTVDGNVNAEQVLGKAKYEGPLYVGKVLGTTRLIK